MSNKRQKSYWLILLCCLGATVAWGQRGQVEIARDGQAQAVIVVPAGWTNDVALPEGLPPQAATLLRQRRELFRESVEDLALYLGRMSGAEIEIVEELPRRDRRTPIYIGSAAEEVFGPVGISKAGLLGFRVVADRRRGLGLYGESEVATSYAIYELLHRLGCRWFMPTDLGEVVPDRPSLSVPVMDEKLAPATQIRGMTQGGQDFQRRNRIGRAISDDIVWLISGDGSIERLFSPEIREANPEWRVTRVDGTTDPHVLRVTHPGVAKHIADQLIEQLETIYEPMLQSGLRPGYSIQAHDGQIYTEDPQDREHDPEPRVWDPAAGRWSTTDRYILLQNRIAKQVRQRFPEVAFRDIAYVNKSLPPVRYQVPEDFHVIIAPIDFNRHHPMTWEDHPNEFWLKDMVQGWGKTGVSLYAYWYGINLAEISAPCPFIAKWGTDISILLENNLIGWIPETMNGWDSMMPGYYLAIRMAFHAHETPDQILDDLWTKFYGAAAEPMMRYWTGIDRAYLEAREYAGSPYGYLKIFTSEVMKAARADINEALALCRTPLEYRRVKLIDESFTLFELYMKMRNDWASGNLRGLEADYDSWRGGILDMVRRYRDPADHTYVQGRHGNPRWSDVLTRPLYQDGSRMEREFVRHGRPMLEWKWKHNPGPEADSLPWTAVDYDDSDWPAKHVVRDTWSSIGHHLTMTDEASGRSGRMVYRTGQKFAALPEDKKAYLWIGMTDGRAKLFVNGQHIPYIVPETTRHHEVGAELERFDGYCRPTGTGFDVTEALIDGDNQFTILAERYNLNELGTGGLMGPVVLYREK